MKKILTAVVAVLAMVTMVFGMTACGQTPEQKLNAYIESETFQTQLDSMKSSVESMMDVDVRAEENKLIYEITYKTQIDDSLLDATKEQLDSTFNAMSSTYENLANSMKEEVGIDNPVVVLSILNADGKEITSLEFSATE
ncbi:MAG: DUF4854 domain-containing protein [Ruminococcus sp.]|nr:DUF4854 domain-containing protein [Ruminococcus sp.]